MRDWLITIIAGLALLLASWGSLILLARRLPPGVLRDLAALVPDCVTTVRRLRMLRNWGGIVDVTPDRSPIIGLTPVPGLFVNCGWGTGGFKATPGSGHAFAHTMARGEPHPLAAPFSLDRFRTGRLIDEAAAAAVAH